MIALAIVMLLCGTVLLMGAGAERVLSRKWHQDRVWRDGTETAKYASVERIAAKRADLEARRVSVAEREIALKEQMSERAPRPEPMPQALLDRIMSWDDDFAQEAERSRIGELYAVHRDWTKVMQSLPALSPLVTTEIAAPREGLIQ